MTGKLTMMSLRKTLGVAVVLAVTLGHAAHADTTKSTKADPSGAIADQMSALLGNEKLRLGTLSDDRLGAIAKGPAKPAAAVPKVRLKAMEPKLDPVVKYDAAWLMSLPAPRGGDEWQCLTEAIYFEARGETLKGQFAVAEVILNRRDSGLYPASVCGVVRQRGGGGCQFSYVCDGHADKMREKGAREIAGRIAMVMLEGAPRALTDGATHFHTRSVKPGWSRKFAQTASIGYHLFYRQPGAPRPG